LALLEVLDLHTYFKTRRGIVKAVNGVSYTLEAGKTLGLVGESGSGKSVSAMSILRLLEGGYIAAGKILFEGEDLCTLSQKQMQHIRGNDISVIFQEPMTSLNPVFTIGRQIGEAFRAHRNMSKKQAFDQSVKMLADVKIPNPEKIARQYPHQLSGGMRQRVMIAMALACQPRLLIADEPTTALDVTIQAQILRLMRELQQEKGTAILFITHDLGVIRQMADEVAVMYCGQVVEMAPAEAIFGGSIFSHPYTEGLLISVPRLDTPADARLQAIPGMVPHPLELPPGCKFAPRCRYACEECRKEQPRLLEVEKGHRVRCFFPNKEERHGR
jgi:peptide/nickel transport system ATP-binding protein